MTMEEIKVAVMTALAMRPPRFGPEVSGGVKAQALADYLLESAFAQAVLEDALFSLDALMEHFRAKVEQMTGWEAALPNKRRDRITQGDIVSAKRVTDPVVFDSGTEVKLLRVTVLRQIDKFRFEAGQGPISRAYTLISGG